jgi:hypothetical protein
VNTSLPRFRCSELDRTFRCHGWISLAESPAAQEANETTSEVASRGTWGHYLIARWALLYMQAYAPDDFPRPQSEYPKWSPVDRWAILFCVRELRATADADMVIEVEVELVVEFDRFILSGHIDVLGINAAATRAKFWDWKLGRLNVDPADVNNQVLGYIVLLFLIYETLEEVTGYLVQPFADVDDGYERVTEVRVQRHQLPQIIAWLVSQIHRALDNRLALDSGEKQCRYCPAVAVCPVIRLQINDMKYLMTEEEVQRISTQEEDMTVLVDVYTDLRALASAQDAAKDRLRHRLHKEGNRMQLPDGRRVYFKKKTTKRYFDVRGKEQFDLVAGKLGETLAMNLYNASVKKVEEEFAQSEHARRPDGTALPKTSKKGESVESKFAAAFEGHVGEMKADILHIDPPEGQ